MTVLGSIQNTNTNAPPAVDFKAIKMKGETIKRKKRRKSTPKPNTLPAVLFGRRVNQVVQVIKVLHRAAQNLLF